ASAAGITARTSTARGFAGAAWRTLAGRAKPATMHRRWQWFGLSALVVAADQAAKVAMLASFAPGERRVFTDFFNLVLVFNKGAAFSFLAHADGWQTPLLAVFASVAAVIVSVL